jgi:hypothetical protein
VIFTVKTLLVPTLAGGLQGEVKEIAIWVALDVNIVDNLLLRGTRLVFLEKNS